MSPTILHLKEHRSIECSRSTLSDDLVDYIKANYSQYLKIEWDRRQKRDIWRITGKGWIGYLPLREDLILLIHPKVAIKNVFQMLQYAYNLTGVTWLNGLIHCEDFLEGCEQLVVYFVEKVLERTRQGLYQNYHQRQEFLVNPRGRMKPDYKTNWTLKWHCRYSQQTTDNPDNQILLWTLYRLLQSSFLQEETRQKVELAFNIFKTNISLKSFTARDCLHRTYHRLNQDYQALHRLCALFLDRLTPQSQQGSRSMIPFLLDMSRIYEQFVAGWLQQHLPHPLQVYSQKRQYLDYKQSFFFDIDLVIENPLTQQVEYILDTKYKITPKPKTSDIFQIMAYGHSVQCNSAILVYPQKVETILDSNSHGLHLRSLVFSLGEDLEIAGQQFLKDLLSSKAISEINQW